MPTGVDCLEQFGGVRTLADDRSAGLKQGLCVGQRIDPVGLGDAFVVEQHIHSAFVVVPAEKA